MAREPVVDHGTRTGGSPAGLRTGRVDAAGPVPDAPARAIALDDRGSELPSVPAAEGAALAAVSATAVRSALDALPEEQRRALALAYFGGYTQREVASLTGTPLGTVKSPMFAGLARLRATLGPGFER